MVVRSAFLGTYPSHAHLTWLWLRVALGNLLRGNVPVGSYVPAYRLVLIGVWAELCSFPTNPTLAQLELSLSLSLSQLTWAAVTRRS